ncbi:MAG: T9SS type A sorting domain-containing protein [Bacteroidota bacterium]
MKHTNFIPINVYPSWKDPRHRAARFQSKNTSWLMACLVFLMTSMANVMFANEFHEPLRLDDEATLENLSDDVTLLNFERTTAAQPLMGSGVACNSQIYVSLSNECNAVITPDMILEGVPDDSLKNYVVNILDGPNAGTDTVTLADLNNRIRVEVTDTSITPNNKCWGFVIVEDKIPPQLVCNDTTILCNTPTTPDIIGGQPTVSQSCAGGVTFTYSDVTSNFNCKQGTGNTPDTISQITRTWQGTDASGNSSTCMQTIFVVKPQLRTDSIIWPSEATLYCGDNPTTAPSNTGFPRVRFNGDTVSIDQFCLFGMNFQDQEFSTSCVGTRKILRTWTLFDWCRNDSIFTNAINPGPQLIKIQDTIGPVIMDLPVVTEIEVLFPDLNACSANLRVPAITVSDVCSPTDSIDVKVQAGNSTVNANGGMLMNVPFGQQLVIYTATDDCGNMTQDTVMINIRDNIAPTVICKENLVVALTQNGTAQVLAQAFDNGTYDNCSLDSIRVRRMDSCGVVMNLPYARSINFECCDVGREIMVELAAWDTVGNTNSCMVRVQVQDKVSPVINCPPDITVNCDTNLTDLTIFGPATVSGGACNASSLIYTETKRLNNCGAGTILRQWTSPNSTDTCTQTITVNLVLNDSFNITRMPDSLIFVQCGTGVDIENLGQDSLQVESIGCQLLAVSYNQRVFNISGECKEVLRTWEIIDWCRNPTANPNMPGYQIVTQVAKLVDTIAPTFVNTMDTMFVNADHSECSATVVLPSFTAVDSCGTTPNIRINGILANSENGFDTLNNVSGGTTVLDVKVGNYRLIYTASDGCNNSTSRPFVVVVRDTEGPTVFCDDIVTTLTLNAGVPANSDDRGWVTVWASDFNCKVNDCDTGQIIQTLRFPSQGIGQSTPPADTSFGWTFNCTARGEQVGDLWVRDAAGNWDYVRVTVDVQDNMNVCPDISIAGAMISGRIQNEAGESVEEVTVKIGGYNMAAEVTGIDGNYEFDQLPTQSNYTVAPEKNMNPLNGVSTFDLVLISKHILGLKKLDSPYKHIAADVNNSGTITAYDLVQLRQLILNVKTEFSNNNSWRFVDASYEFKTDNPAAEAFTEVASVGNLASDTKANFIAVKIGDVNTNAVANRGLISSEARTVKKDLAFIAEDVRFETGAIVNAAFNLTNLENVEGYQFTMNFDPTKVDILQIEEGIAQAANFGTQAIMRGQLTTSWNQGSELATLEDRMFTVVLRAKQAGALSDVVSIGSELTKAEGYTTEGELMNVKLDFGGNDAASKEFALHNNKPNPFKEATIISFDLPKASTAKLTIFDISGRIVTAMERSYEKGYNEVQIEKAVLNGSGIYFYQIETATHIAKKKMILID